MKYLFVLLLNIISLLAFAQTGHYHEFKAGDQVKVFGDNVNIRATASTDAKVIVSLGIGQDVEVLLQTTEEFVLNGVTSNWYQIKFDHQGSSKEGFVWGGLLACYFLEGENDTVFLYGMTKNSEDAAADTEMRVLQGGALVSKVSFHPVGWDGHYIHGKIEDNRGIGEIKNIIRASASVEACGYENGDVILFWDGETLRYVAHETGMGDGGVMGFSKEYIFPADDRHADLVFEQDSEKTYIVELKEEYEYDEIGNGRETKETRVLEWVDYKLVRVRASWEDD